MSRFFNLENPVWRFVGNLADLFLLSILWYLSCIPVFTLGTGTTAMYYVTLKMASNQEGYTFSSFLKSFKQNFKPATLIWLIFLAIGLVLAADFHWSLNAGNLFSTAMFLPFAVVAVLYLLCLALIFPLVARCDNTIKTTIGMCFAMSVRNFLPVLSAIMVTAGFFAVGLFIFWPLLLLAPGLSAYINSFIFNRILTKYHFDLPNE